MDTNVHKERNMAIVVDDNIPDFLRKFLTSQGVISVKDTETGETGVVPIQPRRRRLNTGGGMEGDFEEGSPITTAASGDILDTLRGLFSSDTPMSAEDIATNQALAEAAEKDATDELTYNLERGQPVTYDMLSASLGENPQAYGYNNPTVITDPESLEILTKDVNNDFVLDRRYEYEDPTRSLTTSAQDLASLSSGNSILDGAVNLFSGFGNFVDNSLSKLGGLFSGGFSNPFDFDFTPSIDDRYGPMGPLSGAATAFMDDNLSTDRKVGQIIGGLGAGLGLAAIPGGTVLGLLSAGLGRMGAHHDFNPSTDYNLNFDTRSGRTDWGSTTGGGGGSQYGSLSNANMIEDIAKDNPDYQISLNDGKDGYITAGEFVDINNAYKDIDSSVAFLGPQNFSEALTDFADSSGNMFQSFGGGPSTIGEALTEYGRTGTGAIFNRAGAIADQLGLGQRETRDLADKLAEDARQGGIATSGLFDVDTGTGAAAVSDIASGVSSYSGESLDSGEDIGFEGMDFDF